MTCETCKERNAPVPFVVHESAMARQERTIKRLWVLAIIIFLAFVISNGLWLWYESQFEYFETTVTQDNDSGINTYIGGEGEVIYGEKAFDLTGDADGNISGPEA